MEDIIKLSIEDIEMYEDDEDKDFAIAKLYFLGSGDNSHHLPIGEDVLRKYAKTALGKFVIAKYSSWEKDVTTHVKDQSIQGYISPNSEIKFEYKDGKLFAVAEALMSKLYATEIYSIFKKDNHRSVSSEFTATFGEKDEEGRTPIESFDIKGITILGKKIKPSVAGAEMQFVRFSEEHYGSQVDIHSFAKERREKMEGKTIKINKTELKEGSWGDVDKSSLREKVMNASNRDSIVKTIYGKVEADWKNSPSEHLKYPLGNIIGDTFYFYKGALSSALGYAKKENENEVVSKVEKLYSHFNLDKEEKDKMEEKEKFEEVEEKEDKKEEVEEMSEDKEKMGCEKMEEDSEEEKEDEAKEEEHDEKDEEHEEMSADANVDALAQAKLLEDQAEQNKKTIEEKDDIIMKQEARIKELEAFKFEVENRQKCAEVETTMSDVKNALDKVKFEELREEGLACKFEEVTAWKNKVKALAFEQSKGKKPARTETFMEIPTLWNNQKEEKKSSSLWG